MSGIHYLAYIDRLIYDYYTIDLTIAADDRDNSDYRNPQLAELADTIVARLEEEADHYRHFAARWRGER